jgi:DNA-binding NarL/FixJ family response regulator
MDITLKPAELVDLVQLLAASEHPAASAFHARFSRLKPVIRTCDHCGADFEPAKPEQRFCCDRCRVYSYRANQAARLFPVAAPETREQKALRLRSEGLTQKAIAERLECSISTVRRILATEAK